MGILQRFERRLESIVNGTFARVFRSAVQPVEIAATLQRELDNSAQILSRDSSLVPNDFAVELSPSDHDRLAPYSDKLSQELVEVINNHAGAQHYTFTGPVAVTFERRDNLPTGRFRIRSSAVAGVTQRRPAPPRPSRGPAPAPQPPPYLEVNGVRHVLNPPGMVIGRGSEADLRITDPGVSRRHAEIRVAWDGRAYVLSVHDLGSTNATVVNGKRIDQAPLTDGSQILLGNTVLIVRHRGTPGGVGRS